MRLRQLEVQEAVAAAGAAVAAAGVVGLSGEDNLGSHGEILSMQFKSYPINSDAMQIEKAGDDVKHFRFNRVRFILGSSERSRIGPCPR
jgi:hypothetical protein